MATGKRTDNKEPPGAVTPDLTHPRFELLEARFCALWERCLEPGHTDDSAPEAWQKLIDHYNESHRHYHDTSHLEFCLGEFDRASELVHQPDWVEMAIWFHDVVILPGASDNEVKSAELFRQLAQGRIQPRCIEAVVKLVHATCHCYEPLRADECFVCDIDMSSFGKPWERFAEDSANVKAEYPGSEADYRRSQTEFLERLLNQPRIFITDFFNQLYEQQARANAEKLILLLRPTP